MTSLSGRRDLTPPSSGSLRAARPLLCLCQSIDGDEYVGWRPCPSSLCERRSHVLIHRLATSARDFRYDGFRAWLRWVARGVPADAGEDA